MIEMIHEALRDRGQIFLAAGAAAVKVDSWSLEYLYGALEYCKRTLPTAKSGPSSLVWRMRAQRVS